MPAGPVGSVWESGSWLDTCWEAGVWADLQPLVTHAPWTDVEIVVAAVGREIVVSAVGRSIVVPAAGRDIGVTVRRR